MHESARPDLCGGPRATGVPTAMILTSMVVRNYAGLVLRIDGI